MELFDSIYTAGAVRSPDGVLAVGAGAPPPLFPPSFEVLPVFVGVEGVVVPEL